LKTAGRPSGEGRWRTAGSGPGCCPPPRWNGSVLRHPPLVRRVTRANHSFGQLGVLRIPRGAAGGGGSRGGGRRRAKQRNPGVETLPEGQRRHHGQRLRMVSGTMCEGQLPGSQGRRQRRGRPWARQGPATWYPQGPLRRCVVHPRHGPAVRTAGGGAGHGRHRSPQGIDRPSPPDLDSGLSAPAENSNNPVGPPTAGGARSRWCRYRRDRGPPERGSGDKTATGRPLAPHVARASGNRPR